MSGRLTNMLADNGEIDQIGAAARGDGYYRLADGFHTVAYYLRNFRGRIGLEATLSDDPTESDWFSVPLDQEEFPTVTTGIQAFNVTGNYVYLRARIDRSYLGLPLNVLGHCERVLLSL